jgi:hypothetical protein
MVRLLGVSRSGFYAWLVRVPSQRAIRAERIEAKVAWFHGDSDEVSGSPRILADLRGDGEVISRKTVAKTMRRLHLVGVCPKRWRTTTLINHADAHPVDAAKRDWDKGELNRVWVGDIPYLRTWEEWLYLATVIDAHSRRVIGWAIDEHMRADRGPIRFTAPFSVSAGSSDIDSATMRCARSRSSCGYFLGAGITPPFRGIRASHQSRGGSIGLLLVVVGVILWILGAMGRAVGGPRRYY